VRTTILPTLTALAATLLVLGCQPSSAPPGDDDSADDDQNWSWGSGGTSGDWIYYPYPFGSDPSFLVHAPGAYQPWIGWPVLVYLHDGVGAGELTGEGWTGNSSGNWSALAEAEGFLLVVPGVDWQYSGTPHEWDHEDTDGTLVRIITIVQQTYNVDLDRIHLLGHGTGAFAAERLGFTGSTKLASVGVHGGGLMADWATYPVDPPSRKLPFLVSHDPQDQIVPYAAGENLFQMLVDQGHEAAFRDELTTPDPPDPQHHRMTPQLAAMHWDYCVAHPWAP